MRPEKTAIDRSERVLESKVRSLDFLPIGMESHWGSISKVMM